MFGQEEHAFRCPYCGSEITMILEALYNKQEYEYIEDCEVCCKPIRIEYQFEELNLVFFDASKVGQ